jgi:ATP-dependent protease Clp ATPase subunit
LTCSFCARPQRKTRKLVAGPGVYICGTCVALAESVIASGKSEETAIGIIQAVPVASRASRCSFCGKRRHQATGLATTVDNPHGKLRTEAAICSECLALCREIHAEQLT